MFSLSGDIFLVSEAHYSDERYKRCKIIKFSLRHTSSILCSKRTKEALYFLDVRMFGNVLDSLLMWEGIISNLDGQILEDPVYTFERMNIFGSLLQYCRLQ